MQLSLPAAQPVGSPLAPQPKTAHPVAMSSLSRVLLSTCSTGAARYACWHTTCCAMHVLLHMQSHCACLVSWLVQSCISLRKLFALPGEIVCSPFSKACGAPCQREGSADAYTTQCIVCVISDDLRCWSVHLQSQQPTETKGRRIWISAEVTLSMMRLH